MRTSGGRPALAAGLVAGAVLALGGCGTEHAGDTGATKLGFVLHKDAVEYASVPDKDGGYVPPGKGLRQLVPLGTCALGEGTYANGYTYVNVNWTGSADCTKFTITPRPEGAEESDKPYSMRSGWSGGGLPGNVVVPWGGGSLMGVGGYLTLQSPQGDQTRLATLPLTFNDHPEHETADDASVNAAVKVGSRLLIGGSQTVDMATSPVLFASDDAGATVHRVPLPPVDGGQPRTAVGHFAVHGQEVVAFGSTATNAYDFHSASGTIPYWHSADGGAHWTSGQLTGTAPGTEVNALVYASGRWFAVGGQAAKGALYDSLPLVFTSTDGTHWTRTDTTAMGDGEIDAATVDAAGHAVLVGSAAQHKSNPETPTSYCSAVWLGDGSATGWARGGLGCGEDRPTTAVTLAGGRVLIAGNRDLWASTGTPHPPRTS